MGRHLTKREYAIRRRRKFIALCVAVVVVLAAMVVGISSLIKSGSGENKNNKNNSPSLSPSSSSEEKSKNEKPHKVAKATVVNTGDILVHSTVLDGARVPSTGGYDFSAFFPNAKSFFSNADLAVANLEVTLGGTESGKYSGYPAFNTPDSLADIIKESGIDLLLTANNHCYDTGLFGLKRTVKVLKEKGIEFIGTKENESDHTYIVRNVNGIKIGMVCYTYENTCDVAGRKSINGGMVSTEANNLINSFSYERIDEFYSAAQSVVDGMKKDKADCIVFYMHWGEEYHLTENEWQRTIAQKLCNMGVDVIVGGHPHVVQPVSLLHSEDGENTSVCVYSMGNSISNQRKELMSPECTTGHTEDGMLFYYTFEKYSDGSTVLSSVDIIPTWVNKYKGGSGYLYTMIPLESADDGAAKYGLTGDAATRSRGSYDRTVKIIAAGLTECQTALGCDVRFAASSQ